MREMRYQGAILRNNHLLLLQQHDAKHDLTFWTFPGGSKEPGESDEACVLREMKEETGLDVEVVALLLDEPDYPSKNYKRRRTYLCLAEGEPVPGYEPGSRRFSITGYTWIDLLNEANWAEEIRKNPLVYPNLKNLQMELGYETTLELNPVNEAISVQPAD